MVCLFTFGLMWLEAAYGYAAPEKAYPLALAWAAIFDVFWVVGLLRPRTGGI